MVKSDVTTDQNVDAIQACSTEGLSQNKQGSAMLTGNFNKSTVNLSTNSATTRIANQNTHLSREKDTFIKNWGWAIGDLNDFEIDSKLMSGTMNKPTNSSNSNESEGELVSYIVLKCQILYLAPFILFIPPRYLLLCSIFVEHQK